MKTVPPPYPSGAAATALASPPIPAKSGRLYPFTKRALDIFVALVVLLLLWPLLLIIAVLIRLDSAGPLLHHRRVLARQDYAYGAEPRSFVAYKFRTMTPDADDILMANEQLRREYEKDFKLRNDPRVTRLGAILRSLSLDELPQLINVLRGEMAIVGPRMISPPEIAMYGEQGAHLLSVQPGLTGLWQVSGRQSVPYTERVQLDLRYIEHRSMWLDLKILCRTLWCVLARTGAY